jgi:hypothetical protein
MYPKMREMPRGVSTQSSILIGLGFRRKKTLNPKPKVRDAEGSVYPIFNFYISRCAEGW